MNYLILLLAIVTGLCSIGLGFVALRRQRWELKWLSKWAHSASPRIDLEPPPPNLSAAAVRWSIGFKRWSQKFQQDLLKVRNERELAAESGAQTQRFHARLRHDLRTPLNAMMGFSDLLLQGIDGPLGRHEQQSIEAISASSRSLHHRVEEVLSDSIGIALVDPPGEIEELPSLRFSDRPAITYPAPPSWLRPISMRLLVVVTTVLAALAVVLIARGWLIEGLCSLVPGVLSCVLMRRIDATWRLVSEQATALRDNVDKRPSSIASLDAALRSFELRSEDSRERESTATHFLAERDRKRSHRIARSAATLRAPLDEVCSRTAYLLEESSLNKKQRDSLAHVLRSANLLDMALEELFLLVDYENETVRSEPRWVPTVELITDSIARLRRGFGQEVRVDVAVMPGIAPLFVDAEHFAVAFAGLMRFVLKRGEGAGISLVARSNPSHISIHFQEQRAARHDTVPGRREQELSVLNSGPKLMRLVMEHMAGECRYQLEGELEGWLVFYRKQVRQSEASSRS